jgi:hypothetical protein
VGCSDRSHAYQPDPPGHGAEAPSQEAPNARVAADADAGESISGQSGMRSVALGGASRCALPWQPPNWAEVAFAGVADEA